MTNQNKNNALTIIASMKAHLKKSEEACKFLGLNCFSEMNTALANHILELELTLNDCEKEDPNE